MSRLDRLAAKTTDFLVRVGVSATLTNQTIQQLNDRAAWTKNTFTETVTISPPSPKHRMDGETDAFKASCILAGQGRTIIPKAGMRIIHGSINWTITAVVEYRTGALIAAYELILEQ